MRGASGGSMTGEQWFSRLEEMHIEGADMLVDGRRTVRDVPLNEQLEPNFMRMVCAGDLSESCEWQSE